MHPLAERVLSHIRREELLRAGDRVGVAVSGGIDSVALLRLLLELRSEVGIVISVVHFNHTLRGAESDGDQEFVAGLARAHDLEFFCDSDDVAGHAADEHISLETAARELRYGFFRHLIEKRSVEHSDVKIPTLSLQKAQGQGWGTPVSPLDKIVTGHTLDDQAETVLMRVIRGAGLRGLGGIHPRILFEDDDGEICGEIVRPLLGVRRRELEQYLNDIGQAWREDSTNADTSLTRNRVRRLVVPLLEKEFNPAVAENLAELAAIARGEEDYWENEVAGWMGTAVQWSEPEWARLESDSPRLVQIAAATLAAQNAARMEHPASSKIPTSGAQNAPEMGHPATADLQSRIDNAPSLVMNASVDRLWFLAEPIAVQRRLVKAIGEQAGIPLEFRHVEEILRVAARDSATCKDLSLPLGWKMVCEPDQLRFVTPDLREPVPVDNYEYEVGVPGTTAIRETGMIFEVRRVPPASDAGYNSDNLLDADSVPGPLRVRNWRPGDRFWPAHTKSPKKIKELLQECHVPAAERKLWPVLVSGHEIVWVRGFRVPAKLQAKPNREALLIREIPIGSELET